MVTWSEPPVVNSTGQSILHFQQQQYGGQCVIVQHDAAEDLGTQDAFMMKQAVRWINIVFCGILVPLFSIIGIPGNALCAMVFYRQGLRERINICLYALAISDLVVVIILLLFNIELFMHEVWRSSWGVLPYARGLRGSVWASHFLSAVIASERCFCVVSPFHAKRLLKTSTMASIIVVGCTLLTGGMGALVVLKHINTCRYDPVTNVTEDFIYVTTYYLRNKAIFDAVDIFVYTIALPGIFFLVIVVTTFVTSFKLRAAIAWRLSKTAAGTTRATTAPVTPATPIDDKADLRIGHKEISVTLMLIGTSVLFIACISPNFALQVTLLVVPEFNFTGRYINLLHAVWTIVDCCWVINSSASFVVYFKMGSNFRHTVKSMLGNQRSSIYVNGESSKKYYKG